MRSMAAKRGVSIDELQQIARQDPTVDRDIDQAVRDAGKKERLVIDSRTAFHWIPDSFKIFLKLDPHIAAERTFAQIQSEGRKGQTALSVEEVYEKLLLRIESECERYKEKYGIDYRDESNFDLVVDTAKHSLDEVVSIIVEAYNKRV
jgi:cytidylate kinase